MENTGFEDQTTLFLKLQAELVPAKVGNNTSLSGQLRVVESDLGHLFVNVEKLSNCLGAGGLTYEHAFLKKTGEWSSQHLSKLLEEYRIAETADDTRLFSMLANFQPRVDDAYRHLVNIAELEVNKPNLKTPVFAKSYMRDMGDIIESSLFPFVRLRLKVLELGEKLGRTNRQIDDLSLGTTIAELSRIDQDLYCPEPFKVPLSQWRNISHHSSYRVRGDVIRCEYGSKHHRQQFECSPSQLIEMCRYVDKVYYLHKVAYEVFCTDNIDALVKAIGPTGGRPDLSEFTTDATMAYSIVASGFRILNAARKPFRWAFVLRDMHDRRREDIEYALQEALIPYLLHKGPTEIKSWIESQGAHHFISFRGALKNSDEVLDDELSSFTIGKNFRIKESSGDIEAEEEKD